MVNSVRLVRVVTHHREQLRHAAAELFERLGVAAVGWHRVGNLIGKTREEMKAILLEKEGWSANHASNSAGQLLAWRDKVRKENGPGPVIFAYECKNMVALVGEVIGRYKFDSSNELGDLNGEFKYPQQIEVKWRPKPRYFNRNSLPDLSEWLASRGTIALRNYDRESLERMLRRIDP